MSGLRTSRLVRDSVLLAGVAAAVAVGWMIQPDSMQAEGPRLREVGSKLLAEPTLGSLEGPQGTTIVVIPGHPHPRWRLLDRNGREVVTVEDSAVLEIDHDTPDPGRLLADVPIWDTQD